MSSHSGERQPVPQGDPGVGHRDDLATAPERTAHGSERHPLLQLEGISYWYPTGLPVLNSVDLEVRAGEVVAVVGPSGCGKSTLLSIIADLRQPTEGVVTWHDLPGAANGNGKRRLSLVFQRDTVLPWRTVEQNIAFGLKYIDISDKERKERVDRLLALGRLTDFRSHYPKQLSGGMRRRVALLTGVAPLPEVLLLDEPFSGLDEPTRVGVHSDLLEIVYELNLTVIIVTHDIGEAISLADRILVLTKRPSRISWSLDTSIGRPRDLLSLRATEQYSDLYAATWSHLWRVNSGGAPAPPAMSAPARDLAAPDWQPEKDKG